MNCRHCHEPLRRCIDRGYPGHGPDCKGWRHTRTATHLCGHDGHVVNAEPEPGQLPAVQAPASKPRQEVA